MDMTKITKFYFQRAKYLVGDENGNEVYMKINYKGAKFEIQSLRVNDRDSFKLLERRVGKLAKELILRKHKVNFFAKIST